MDPIHLHGLCMRMKTKHGSHTARRAARLIATAAARACQLQQRWGPPSAAAVVPECPGPRPQWGYRCMELEGKHGGSRCHGIVDERTPHWRVLSCDALECLLRGWEWVDRRDRNESAVALLSSARCSRSADAQAWQAGPSGAGVSPRMHSEPPSCNPGHGPASAPAPQWRPPLLPPRAARQRRSGRSLPPGHPKRLQGGKGRGMEHSLKVGHAGAGGG